jgi:hypothetical protein
MHQEDFITSVIKKCNYMGGLDKQKALHFKIDKEKLRVLHRLPDQQQR